MLVLCTGVVFFIIKEIIMISEEILQLIERDLENGIGYEDNYLGCYFYKDEEDEEEDYND